MCVVSGIQFIQTLSSKFQEFVPEGSFMTTYEARKNNLAILSIDGIFQ